MPSTVLFLLQIVRLPPPQGPGPRGPPILVGAPLLRTNVRRPVGRPKNVIKTSLVRGNDSWTRRHAIAGGKCYVIVA